MDKIFLILLGVVFGGLVTYGYMRMERAYKQKVAEIEKLLNELREQLKGKQLPYHVRDELENIRALERMDSLDLARVRLYLVESLKTVDAAASRQHRMGEIYESLRSPGEHFRCPAEPEGRLTIVKKRKEAKA